MNKLILNISIFLTTIFLTMSVFCKLSAQNSFPMLAGPYLGQKAPSKKAELFAPGIISTISGKEMCAAFSKDGKEFYFNAIYKKTFSIYVTKEIGGNWTTPTPLYFSNEYTDRDFTISPDGNKIFFGSNRPRTRNGEKLNSLDIYFIQRNNKKEQWSEPQNIGHPINTSLGENYPSIALNGNLYFFSCNTYGKGGCDIYMAPFKNGRYLKPVNLGGAINSNKNDWDAYIALDESYIIFSSMNRDDTHGTQDLYISFKKNDGNWTKAKNMGLAVNSAYDEICPSLTIDGKYLFFTSRRRGKSDIYWVNAKILDKLKPISHN